MSDYISQKFGLAPAGAGFEYVETTLFDTLYWGASATVATVNPLFIPGTKTGAAWMQNFSVPASLNRNITILAIRVTAQVNFTVPSSHAAAGFQQDSFFRFSSLQWQIESKQYNPIPLDQLYTNDFYNLAGTLANRDKRVDYQQLANPIELPPQGQVNFWINANPSGLTTSATAIANLPGLSLTNDLGFYVKVDLYGVEKRPIM